MPLTGLSALFAPTNHNKKVCEDDNYYYQYTLIYKNAPTVEDDGTPRRYTPIVQATADMGLATEKDAGTAQVSHVFIERVKPFKGTHVVYQTKGLFSHLRGD